MHLFREPLRGGAFLFRFLYARDSKQRPSSSPRSRSGSVPRAGLRGNLRGRVSLARRRHSKSRRSLLSAEVCALAEREIQRAPHLASSAAPAPPLPAAVARRVARHGGRRRGRAAALRRRGRRVRRCPSYGAKRRDAALLLMLLRHFFALLSLSQPPSSSSSLCVSSTPPLQALREAARARGSRARACTRAREEEER